MPSASAVYIPAGAGAGVARNAICTSFIFSSPATSDPSNDAFTVSWYLEVMSSEPSFWVPKNHASSLLPSQA